MAGGNLCRAVVQGKTLESPEMRRWIPTTILRVISAPASIKIRSCSFKRSIAVAAGLSGCSGHGARRVATVAAAKPTKAKDNDTVFALSTAPGRAAIAIVRLTGPDCDRALSALLPKFYGAPPPRQLTRAALLHPVSAVPLDDAMVVRFPAPASVTGEDCAELHLHGSHAVVSAVLQALRSLPFVRPAQAGEFTRRAFEGGKLDLTQVEGLSDLLSARTESQRAQALFAARGSLGRRYARWRETLLSSLAAVEACIDFGEDEHIADQVAFESEARIKALAGELRAALRTRHRGELVREGLRVAIMGAPNAGKSSLLNALAGRSIAIVSAVPGTTRDVLHADLDLGGICARVSDCAGLRETADEIEKEGVRRALELAKEAHLLVLVVDDSAAKQASVTSLASETLEGADVAPQQLMQLARPHARVVLVRNKADLAPGPGRATANAASWAAAEKSPTIQVRAECNVSCVTGEGIDALVAVLGEQAAAYVERSGDAGEDHSEAPTTLITRERHRRAVEEALEHLEAYAAHPTTLELAGEDIRRAARALGSVTGALETEDVLDRVFSQFCIGK